MNVREGGMQPVGIAHVGKPRSPHRKDATMANPDRYSRRSSLSADYTDPERESAQSGVTNKSLPRSGTKRAAMWVGILGAIVVALLVSRMPFLAGSLNAGAPVDEIATGSVQPLPSDDPFLPDDAIGEDGDASSAMPTPNRLTPSTVPAGADTAAQ